MNQGQILRKKLIEAALPLDAINKEALHRKQKAPKGWPASFHKWWSQKPLAAARAVIFAQMVDDPSAYPDLFPTDRAQDEERLRLFQIIEDLVQWENTTNESVVRKATDEIRKTWQRTCAKQMDNRQTEDQFDEAKIPPFLDPFAGSGSLPLSAQWLGLESHARELNPVAVLINKAVIEIPPKFAGNPPVNPGTRVEKSLISRDWRGTEGLAEDVRYYGHRLRDEAEKRIGYLYPKFEISAAISKERPDLQSYVGQSLTIIAWLWARTVKSPNPAFADIDVPLTSTFLFSTKPGKEASVEPIIEGRDYRFTVKVGKPKDTEAAKRGTKSGSSGSSFLCLMSGTPMTFDYLRSEAKAGRIGVRLMAMVAEGDRGRVYLSPTPEMEALATGAVSRAAPETNLPAKALGFRVQEYGMTKWRDLFTQRQLAALTTFSDLIGEAIERIRCDAAAASIADNNTPLRDGGTGSQAYAEAVAVYLACAIDRMAYYGSSLSTWLPKDNALRDCMPRQALSMTWEFAESNPLGKSSGDILTCVSAVSNYLDRARPHANAFAKQEPAQAREESSNRYVISTDPPYYDNVGYADLSDFFYVWLRRSLRPVFPDLFATVEVPKLEELVATPYRHGGKEKAENFFLNGMTEAMNRLAERAHPAFPITVYYAFKQSERETDAATASTGWETFLGAMINAGLCITGTWPLRTEGAGRLRANDSNALASSIVLVCRPRIVDAPTVTRREFLNALKAELPAALAHLQHGNIAPVDLAQAAIGPGMAVYTRYAKVLDAEGKSLSVRQALALINEILDEALAEQEGDFDADSRWAVTWFEQSGFAEDDFGVAEQLSKSKNTSVAGMAQAGILYTRAGRVRLFKPEELPADWDPDTDPRLTAWEIVHQLIRSLESGGEGAAAALVAKLGAKAEIARELAYRLYMVSERKKRAAEALSYNGLVQSWPEITRLARDVATVRPTQPQLI